VKTVKCTECQKPIENRNDLAVADKLLSPYHKKCLDNPDFKLGKLHKFIGPFPLGPKFFLLFLIGNLLLIALIMRHQEAFYVLIVFQVVSIFPRPATPHGGLRRSLSTACFERHLR
jgi:hypothetical protein